MESKNMTVQLSETFPWDEKKEINTSAMAQLCLLSQNYEFLPLTRNKPLNS